MKKRPSGTKAQPFTPPREPIVGSVPLPQEPKLSVQQALALADRHRAAGHLQQAEYMLRQILATAPQYAPALHLLGVVAHDAGKADVAIKLIGQAIAIEGNNALYHANIAEMHRRLGRLDDAIRHGRKAVAINPGLLAAQSNLGIAYYDREKFDKAEECHCAALAINTKFAPSLNNMGSIRRKQNKDREAHDYFQAAIEADPHYLDAQNNLGEILTHMGRPEEALAVLDAVIRKNPCMDNAHANMGLAYLALGNEAEMRSAFARALAINPRSVPAHTGFALAMLEFQKLEEGLQAARRLRELDPRKPDAHSIMGSLLTAQGLTEEAEDMFAKALSLDPAYIPAKVGMGHILMEKGDLKGAQDMFRSCMAMEGETSPALYSLIQARKMKDGDPEIALMEKEAQKLQGKLIDSKAISLNFALGKMYDDLGQYDKGFPYYIEGCRLKRKSFSYSMEEKQKSADRTKKIFTKEFVAKHTGNGHDSNRPIFVLGMPRSGTTLTEQIIASHSSVHGAGELRDIARVFEAEEKSFHDLMPGADGDDWERMGRTYTGFLDRFGTDAARITDKMPGNYHYLGAIRLMLPNAKIVHVSRDPLDTCLSCFMHLFAHGQLNTYDLAEIGHTYKCYRELMDHWQAVLPEESFYNIRYESLVDDTEGEARKLLAYCGLEWEESCLEFYKTQRIIRTASVAQVRQPIYKTSKQRWKNYEKFLGPLIEALGPALEKQAS